MYKQPLFISPSVLLIEKYPRLSLLISFNDDCLHVREISLVILEAVAQLYTWK